MYGIVGIGILCSIDAITRNLSDDRRVVSIQHVQLLAIVRDDHDDPNAVEAKGFTHLVHCGLLALLLLAELAWTPGFKNGILNILNFVTVFGLFTYLYRCRKKPSHVVRPWR